MASFEAGEQGAAGQEGCGAKRSKGPDWFPSPWLFCLSETTQLSYLFRSGSPWSRDSRSACTMKRANKDLLSWQPWWGEGSTRESATLQGALGAILGLENVVGWKGPLRDL